MDVLRRAVMATNRFGAGELDELRIRIGLISSVPTLVAHSAVRYAEWCQVVAEFVAGRLGGAPDDLGPQTVARAALGAAMAAFAWWARHDADDLIGRGGPGLPAPGHRVRRGPLGPGRAGGVSFGQRLDGRAAGGAMLVPESTGPVGCRTQGGAPR